MRRWIFTALLICTFGLISMSDAAPLAPETGGFDLKRDGKFVARYEFRGSKYEVIPIREDVERIAKNSSPVEGPSTRGYMKHPDKENSGDNNGRRRWMDIPGEMRDWLWEVRMKVWEAAMNPFGQ